METPATSVATSLGWQTHISRTSVGSLSRAGFSDQQSRQVNGLEDVIRAVRSLDLPYFRYEGLVKKSDLGEGETYRVEQCSSRDHVVAVKHLKVKQGSSEHDTFRHRLRAVVLEIQVMQHPPLRAHPNLPSVFGYGWKTLGDSILPFIVVEYAGLGTLREYIKKNGLRPESHLKDLEILLGDVVSGLTALHSCGIVHGDVKLDNVLVFPSRDNPAWAIAKVADFGHAIVLNDTPGSTNMGQLRYYGTTIYNAPEVTTQDQYPIESSDLFKCDIWAFGLLVWEACIEGEEYLHHMKIWWPTMWSDDDEDCFQYGELRELAKYSLPGPRNTLGAAMFLRITLHKTLQEDPSQRASSAQDLPIYSRWNTGSLKGLSADLALHLETPLPTYEMFRLDNGREISWTHQQQIFRGLQHTHAGDLAKEHNVFTWQLSLSYFLGFGIPKNTTTAHHFAKLAEADNHPVALVFSDLFARTPTLKSAYADCIAGLLRSTNICSAWPPLVEAAFAGDAPVVLNLLRAGADPNTCTVDGCGLFHWLFVISESASFNQVVDALNSHRRRLLLDEAFTTTRDVHSQWPLQLLGNPLAIAISVQSEAGVRALLRLGANPFALVYGNGSFPKSDPRSSWTAFHIAVKYHSVAILRVMVSWLDDSKKALLQTTYPLGSALTFSTPMERLAMHGISAQERLAQTIAFIVQWQKIDAVEPNGMTSLMQSIDFEDEDVVSELLRADPKLAGSPFRSPLNSEIFNFPIHFAVQIAARRDTPEALEIPKLINARSQDLNPAQAPCRDHLGRTLLHLAVTGGSNRVTTWILENREGLSQVEDQDGRTPLHYCTSKANCESLLKAKGANINHTDEKGMTSLHKACYLGNQELVKTILQYRPNLHLSNNVFGTPLHCAVIRGSLECVLLLLDADAPLESTDPLGNTAMHVAARLDRYAISRLLMSRGAMADAKNNFGRDPLSIALTGGRFGSRGVVSVLQGKQATSNMKTILLAEPEAEEIVSFETIQSLTIRGGEGTSYRKYSLLQTHEFQWLQETLASVIIGSHDLFAVGREAADVSFALQESHEERQQKMRCMDELIREIKLKLRLVVAGFRAIEVAISIYFDDTVWRCHAESFLEIMLDTAAAIIQEARCTDALAAFWTARIISQTRPEGAFPGRDEKDLESIIYGELKVMGKSNYGMRACAGDFAKAQDGRLHGAVNVMEEYRKWLRAERVAASSSEYLIRRYESFQLIYDRETLAMTYSGAPLERHLVERGTNNSMH